MAGESTSPHCRATAQMTLCSVELFHAVWNETVLESFNAVCLQTSSVVCKINFHAFYIFMFVLLVFNECLEPHSVTLKTDSDICDSDVRDFDVRDFDVRDECVCHNH